MATILKAGNVATGAQITSDATGILEIRTGTGAGTTAITVGTDQAVTIGGNNISAVNSLGFRNRIINGDMRIDQRNAGASVTPTDQQLTLDRWKFRLGAASKISTQQSSTAPAGFTNSLLVTSLSSYSSGASEQFYINQRIEGFNVADLGWGAAGAATVTLSFWVRSSLTGTFGGAVFNADANRSYPFTFTISSANTFEYKTVTIAGDTTGTWNTGNGIGISLAINLGSGSSLQATAGAWASGFYPNATGATSVVGTNGATFYITGVQLEAGSVATPFERRDYGRELIMAQRYYYKIGPGPDGARIMSGFAPVTTLGDFSIGFPVTMRTNPTSLSQSGTAADYAITYSNSTANCSSVPEYLTASNNTGAVRFIVSSGLTAGHGVQGRLNTNGFLAWSAEL